MLKFYLTGNLCELSHEKYKHTGCNPVAFAEVRNLRIGLTARELLWYKLLTRSDFLKLYIINCFTINGSVFIICNDIIRFKLL